MKTFITAKSLVEAHNAAIKIASAMGIEKAFSVMPRHDMRGQFVLDNHDGAALFDVDWRHLGLILVYWPKSGTYTVYQDGKLLMNGTRDADEAKRFMFNLLK